MVRGGNETRRPRQRAPRKERPLLQLFARIDSEDVQGAVGEEYPRHNPVLIDFNANRPLALPLGGRIRGLIDRGGKEKRDHHPDVLVGWGKARVLWTTHDAGGLTRLDLDLAEATDKLATPD